MFPDTSATEPAEIFTADGPVGVVWLSDSSSLPYVRDALTGLTLTDCLNHGLIEPEDVSPTADRDAFIVDVRWMIDDVPEPPDDEPIY